ncbi:hypothetical protein [Actinoplanes sp. GCM10030250]|uniref:hypothetical protein n=1 Tax=Actinoplanes sp. GCM10030250 TaxID=3273376 RepID=UPI003622EED7
MSLRENMFRTVVGFAAVNLIVAMLWWGFSIFFVAIGQEVFGSLGCLLLVGIFAFWPIKNLLSRRKLHRYAATAGWQSVDPGSRDWPWDNDLHAGDEVRSREAKGSIRVRSAWHMEVDGVPAVAGEVTSTGTILEGTVGAGHGSIVFVLINLPRPIGTVGMRTPYQHVGESARSQQVSLNVAFLSGEIPPWTARGSELFTFQRPESGLTEAGLHEAVRRTLRVAEVLDTASASS